MTPWLSIAEIEDLCAPLTQPAAQCRFLRETFGIEVKRRPDGSVLVMRAQLEGPNAPAAAVKDQLRTPNVTALQAHFRKRA